MQPHGNAVTVTSNDVSLGNVARATDLDDIDFVSTTLGA